MVKPVPQAVTAESVRRFADEGKFVSRHVSELGRFGKQRYGR